MAVSRAPNSQGQFRQNNQSDIFEELWATFGVDLSTSYGKLKTARALGPTMSQELLAQNANTQAMALYNGDIWAFGSGGQRYNISAERNPRVSGNWVSASSPLDIGEETDAVVFDGKLLISGGNDITAYDGSTFDDDWWTNVVSGTALQVGVPHTMAVQQTGRETLFVTDENRVRYYNSTAGHSTVTLATQLTACCLAPGTQSMYVGTYSNEGSAFVYEIFIGETDALGTPQARFAYKIKGAAVLSIEVIDGRPFIVTDKGHIQTLNGDTFVTIARFPFAMDGVTIAGMSLGDIEEDNTARAIHPKGMRASDRSLFININTNNELITDLASNPVDNDDVFENVVVNDRSPSGIWEYNLDTGVLFHRYGLRYDSTQCGFHRHQASGPLLIVDNQYTKLLAAGRVQADRTDIYAENPSASPCGYFITPEIDTGSVTEAWERFVVKNDILDNSSVLVKYRTQSYKTLYKEANWTAADTFVIAENIEGQLADEYLVEVIDGYGAGKLAHIKTNGLNFSASTTTVMLDTAIGQSGEANQIRIWNFKPLNTEDFKQHITGGLAEVSEWVQYMVYLDGMVTVRQYISKGTVKNEL